MRRSMSSGKGRTRPVLLTIEAAVVTLVVHAMLYFAIGYQPKRISPPETQASGVSLLNLASPRADEKQLSRWLAFHEPAQFSSSGNPAGYTALLRSPQLRDYSGSRPWLQLMLPQLVLPTYELLQPLPDKGEVIEELQFLPLVSSSGASIPQVPLVFDADNHPIVLSRLSTPVGHGATAPTVVRLHKVGGVVRLSPISGSGDAELDAKAFQALLRSEDELPDTPAIITIYWPQSVSKDGGK